MTREEAIERYGQPDKCGHITRFSDSSFYDEKCVMCGATDGRGGTLYSVICPAAPAEELAALREQKVAKAIHSLSQLNYLSWEGLVPLAQHAFVLQAQEWLAVEAALKEMSRD